MGKIIDAEELKKAFTQKNSIKTETVMRIIDMQKPVDAIPVDWLMEYAESSTKFEEMIMMIKKWRRGQ